MGIWYDANFRPPYKILEFVSKRTEYYFFAKLLFARWTLITTHMYFIKIMIIGLGKLYLLWSALIEVITQDGIHWFRKRNTPYLHLSHLYWFLPSIPREKGFNKPWPKKSKKQVSTNCWKKHDQIISRQSPATEQPLKNASCWFSTMSLTLCWNKQSWGKCYAHDIWMILRWVWTKTKIPPRKIYVIIYEYPQVYAKKKK